MEDILMKYFKDEPCQVCLENFKEGDQIVVCPECGDPYHKECYKKIGKCLHDESHGEYFYTNKRIDEIKNRAKQNEDGESSEGQKKTCLFCKAQSSEDAVICENCGMPFEGDIGTFIFGKNKVVCDGEIDGIDVKHWIEYIGQNALSYILKFKTMCSQKYRSLEFNFSAAIFGEPYFFYRKMYLYGVLFLLLRIVVSSFILLSLLPGNLIKEIVNLSELGFGSNLFLEQYGLIMDKCIRFWQDSLQVYTCVSIFTLGLSVVRGLVATKIYKRVSRKRIKSIDKSLFSTEQEYKDALARKGGVNYLLGSITFIILNLTFLINF